MDDISRLIQVNIYKQTQEESNNASTYSMMQSISVKVEQSTLSSYAGFRNKLAVQCSLLNNGDLFVRLIEDPPEETAIIISSSAELLPYFKKQEQNDKFNIGLLIYEKSQLQNIKFIGVDEAPFYPKQPSLDREDKLNVAQQYVKVYIKKQQLQKFLAKYYELLTDKDQQ